MSIQLSPIEAHERTIGQIFDDAYAFEIPAYQRPYAWEIDQVRELLNDLTAAMDDQASSGGVYFLGSIVLIKSPGNPQSVVIDGQQRLTTLTILLSVLRDLTTENEKKIDRRRYVLQKANPDRGTSERFRLLLRLRDRPFFLKFVQEPGSTEAALDVESLKGSQYRIAANTRYLREQLQLLDESRRDKLIAFIVQRCYLVVVAVPTAEAARRIFTVLNARGLDLTPTDILKANLLDRAGSSAEAALADRWEAVEIATSRDGMVELFGHIRMIFEREKPRLALEAAFPKFVTPFQGSADGFLSNVLEPVADAYAILKDDKAVQKRFGNDAAKAVRSLMRIDNKDWVPPALLKLWKQKQDGNGDVAQFLIRLERVAYYLFVLRLGVNERIARFAAIMNEIEPSNGAISPALALSEIEQADFIHELDGDLYRKTRVCKPVLQRLDEALSTGGASYDNLVSIEHVLPQTVGKGGEWEALFPNEIEREEWTHRLANLVLLTQRVNTRASNWSFEKKKEEYFGSEDGSSPFVLTQEVLQTKRWSLEHLFARQQRLLWKLALVWDLDISKVQNQDLVDDVASEKLSKASGDASLIDSKREAIIKAAGVQLGADLVKKGRVFFASENGQLKVVCTISKRYPTGSPYWYGYSPQWDEFLSEGKSSFLILGCLDRNSAYLLPHGKIKAVLKHLHKTGDRHWHLDLAETAAGKLELVVTSAGSRLGLSEFEV